MSEFWWHLQTDEQFIRMTLWQRWRNAWEMFWVYLLGDGQGNPWPPSGLRVPRRR